MAFATPDLLQRLKFLSNPAAVAITASSVQSGTLDAGSLYMLFNGGTATAYFLQGTNPTAIVGSNPIAPGAYFPQPVHLTVPEGQRIAVISSVVSGSLFILKMES